MIVPEWCIVPAAHSGFAILRPLRRWPVSPRRSIRRCTGSPATTGCPGWISPRGSARTTSRTSTWPRFDRPDGVLFVGRRRRRPPRFGPRSAATPRRARSYPWIVAATGVVNQYYIYCAGPGLRPVLCQVLLLLPLQREAVHQRPPLGATPGAGAGIAFTALDNGFASLSSDPSALQRICDRLSAPKIDAFFASGWRCCRTRSPRPTGAPATAIELSILQAEFSLTQVLDRPLSGRVFFEPLIRENLDLGRPDQVSLIFDRRVRVRGPTADPGGWRTRVLTDGVTPSIHVDYKHSRIKQYHKPTERCRTETTINDTPGLRDRQTAGQPARAATDRLPSQPATARHPTTRPRPDHRRPRARHHTGAPPLQAASRAYNDAVENLSHTTLLAA